MISGMSREKPALDLFRYMESAWSLYERMGDRIRKRGAQKPATDASHCMVKMAEDGARHVSGKRKGLAMRQDSKIGGRGGAVTRERRREGQISKDSSSALAGGRDQFKKRSPGKKRARRSIKRATLRVGQQFGNPRSPQFGRCQETSVG